MSNLLKSKAAKAVFGLAVFVAVLAAASVASAYTFTPPTLRVGSTGTAVMELQKILNAGGYANPALVTDGSFGQKTATAVMAWQAAAGLTADGVVGPASMAVLNGGTSVSGNFPAGCTSASGYSTTTGMACNSGPSAGLPAGCSSTAGYSSTTGTKCDSNTSSSGGNLSGGETSISNVKTTSADDTSIKEGASKADVATIKFTVKDADAQLTRADIVFEANGGNDETKPWKVFDTVYLMDGSKELGSMDSSSKSDWDETSSGSGIYRVRMSGLAANFKEGVHAELTVAADVTDSIDGIDDGEDWDVYIDDTNSSTGLRFVDGAGINTVDNGTGTASFSLEASGANSDLTITKDSSTPAAGTLQVDETSSTTETIAVFKIKADSDGGDVKIDNFPVTITTGGSDNDEIVDDITLVIDGTTYSTDDTPDADSSTTFNFTDIEDDDVVIDAGDTMKVTVKIKFKSQNAGGYANSDTIYATSAADENDFEDADTGDDIGNVSGTPSGNTMQLYATGLTVSNFKVIGSNPIVTTNNAGENTKLAWKVSFDVSAFGDTFYIPKAIEQGATIAGASGLSYTMYDETAGSVTTAGTESASTLSSSASDTDFSGYYTVDEGDTKTFTATMSEQIGTITAGHYVHLQLTQVGYNTDGSGADETLDLAPAGDYDTLSDTLDA